MAAICLGLELNELMSAGSPMRQWHDPTTTWETSNLHILLVLMAQLKYGMTAMQLIIADCQQTDIGFQISEWKRFNNTPI